MLRRDRRPDSRGSVTAEMAVALPALMALLGVALTAVGAVTAELRCVDASREGARAAARGDSIAVVRLVAARLAPPHASVTVDAGSETVTVGVRARLRPLGLPLPLPPVAGRAVAATEPGVAR